MRVSPATADIGAVWGFPSHFPCPRTWRDSARPSPDSAIGTRQDYRRYDTLDERPKDNWWILLLIFCFVSATVVKLPVKLESVNRYVAWYCGINEHDIVIFWYWYRFDWYFYLYLIYAWIFTFQSLRNNAKYIGDNVGIEPMYITMLKKVELKKLSET